MSFNIDQLPDTSQPQFNTLVKTPDVKSWGQWFNSGSVALYPYLSDFIARSKGTKEFTSPLPTFPVSMGYAPMTSQPFFDLPPLGIQQLQQFFPFFFMIIFLIPFYYITSKIASEKESKSREGMKMMGLDDSTYFLSWFFIFFLISVLVSLIVTLLSCLGVFLGINIFLFFVFSVFYSLTLYGWAFTIVAFLPTKRSSGIAATLLHIISFYLCYIIQDANTPSGIQYAMSLLPNVCMNQILKQVFFFSFSTLDGLTFSTMSVVYQGYSFRNGLLMMILNVVLWTLLGIYMDQVIPSQFGVAKPWNFLCKRKKGGEQRKTIAEEQRDALLADNENEASSNNFEPVTDNLKQQEASKECLIVRNLVKQFGEKKAVNGTNLTMYNGQIFALLGHNGAGKTTTISMLTGLITPTSGFAEVFGIDIFNNMDEIRKILGVCPQHDVLFDFLTPEDHLRLFAAYKGGKPEEIEEQVQRMLEEIDLVDVKTQLSKTLSGGQKRKLSVAIAMIGNSKVVILDEPTSGMDTSARRRLWEMLKKNKAGRIVILTTHYMDEADMLGDRISIMAEGKVQCTGSSLFLKNRYGVGYNLVIAKKDRNPAPQIEKFIKATIPTAVLMQEVSSEISFQLPKESSALFKDFFLQFDNNLDSLGIRSYGVGITTLEEVFLKIGHGEDVEEERNQRKVNRNQSGPINDASLDEKKEADEFNLQQHSLKNAFFLNFTALLKKKILMQVRDGKTLLIDTIFPIVLIFAGLALSTVAVIREGQERELSPFIYPATDGGLGQGIHNNLASTSLDEAAVKTFIDDVFIGENHKQDFQALSTVSVDTTGSLSAQVKEYDSKVYDMVFNSSEGDSGAGPYYG
mmetsp:Transcript_270/g.475  ORF Transcript_270/g.475 Transcript_270/m.475 type:complete len:855 (-) Transcript_270:2340-4904(-)